MISPARNYKHFYIPLMSERHSRYQTFCDYWKNISFPERGKKSKTKSNYKPIDIRSVFLFSWLFLWIDKKWIFFPRNIIWKHHSVIRKLERIVKRLCIDILVRLVNPMNGLLTCLLKTATSSLKESDEHTSPPATPGSRGVQVASSHFSNINASSGNSGCL